MSVTLYTAAYNGYWERFGETWTKFVERLDPQPTEVIVVSDKPIDTKFKVVIETDLHIGSFRNAAIRAASCDWVVPSDIDDEPYVHYVDNLDSNFDIIAYTLIDIKGRVYGGKQKAWNKFLEADTRNGVVGTSAVKRSFLLQCPYRKLGWEDWALWLDLKRAGAKIKFDPTIRFKYNRTSEGLSSQNQEEKTTEIIKFKEE